MDKITVDDELKKKLMCCSQPALLCDASGQVLGEVYPMRREPLISEEEMDRREREEELYSTEEVLKYLKSLQ